MCFVNSRRYYILPIPRSDPSEYSPPTTRIPHRLPEGTGMTFTQKCLTISFLLISFQVHSVEPPRSEVETINAVIKEFQDSILQKDKKRFLALFQSETTPFIGINSDADVEL